MAKSTTTTVTKPNPRDAQVSRGKVQRIYTERGFGFIRCTEGAPADVGADFFFHYSGLEDCRIEDLMEGLTVSFEPTIVPKGKRAEKISIERAGA